MDFPGAISFGPDLETARKNLARALVDMTETNLIHGEPLPNPDSNRTDPEADLEEPICLLPEITNHMEKNNGDES